MNELTTLLDDREKLLLSNEIEKLFVLQDRPLSKEKRSIFVDEVAHSGLPLSPLLSGLRKLMGEDLRKITKEMIIEAAMEFIVDSSEIVSCDHCSGGIITAKDSEGYYFALACTCSNGKRQRRLEKWDGTNSQMVRERLLTIEDRHVG